MGRYQCPLCLSIHRREQLQSCSSHTFGYDPECAGCLQAVAQTPCGGTG
ncbi:hypothetical protein [Streptosporangium longisporum]|uniref:Uncharacterized protein n=1 Tax=Streptosporangium longisporum TaxID=46187 RepID=A0ABP6LE73_9ACTN